jgi:hypothetical protein
MAKPEESASASALTGRAQAALMMVMKVSPKEIE